VRRLLALAVTATACQPSATELVVQIDSDYSTDELTEIDVEVGKEDDAKTTFQTSLTGLPFSFGIRPADGVPPGKAFQLEVTGRGDGFSVRRTVRTFYFPDESRFLIVYLSSRCRGVDCDDPSKPTCGDDGLCHPIPLVDPEQLPEPPPEGQLPVRYDAGVHDDATTDVRGPDAARDSGVGDDGFAEDASDTDAIVADAIITDTGEGMDAGVPPDAGADTPEAGVTDASPPDAGPSCSSPTSVAAGRLHSCAISGTGNVCCWGQNLHGELGPAATLNQSNPTPVPVPGIDEVRALALGGQFSCALREDGTVWCWGSNFGGTLGRGSLIGEDATPAPVPGLSGVDALRASHNNVCARRGTDWLCWGANNHGQLTFSGANAILPFRVAALAGATEVELGEWHGCAIFARELRCWGSNRDGQLGPGAPIGADDVAPVVVPGVDGARAVSANGGHTCALRDDRTVTCWGARDRDQLDGITATATTALILPGVDDTQVLAGFGAHNCVVRSDDSMWCWGANDVGQVGHGGLGTPGAVMTLPDAPEVIAVGSAHNCVLLKNGQVVCWGYNLDGQCGPGGGAMPSVFLPVAVPL